MADDVSSHLKMQNDMTRLLQQNQVLMDKMYGNLDKVSDEFKGINTDLTKMEKSLERTNITIKDKVTKNLKSMGSEIKDHILAPFAAIFSGTTIMKAGEATLKHNEIMKNLSFRMGDAGKSTQFLHNSLTDVALSLGLSTDEVEGLVVGLKQLRVANKDITELAASTGQFSKVIGISAQSAVRLTGELIRSGKIGKAATQDILAGMARMQRVIGLTEGEMEQLNDTIISSTIVLGGFNKSPAEI